MSCSKTPLGEQIMSEITSRSTREGCASIITAFAQKIHLHCRLDLAMCGGHEVCSSVHRRLHWVCIANICGLATALSGKAGATV